MVCLDGNDPIGIKSQHNTVKKMPRIQMFPKSLKEKRSRGGIEAEREGEMGKNEKVPLYPHYFLSVALSPSKTWFYKIRQDN